MHFYPNVILTRAFCAEEFEMVKIILVSLVVLVSQVAFAQPYGAYNAHVVVNNSSDGPVTATIRGDAAVEIIDALANQSTTKVTVVLQPGWKATEFESPIFNCTRLTPESTVENVKAYIIGDLLTDSCTTR